MQVTSETIGKMYSGRPILQEKIETNFFKLLKPFQTKQSPLKSNSSDISQFNLVLQIQP